MPIDPSKALGAALPELTTSWTKDQVILYHLGIGAGTPPTEPGELEYCYEPKLKVLPTFAVIPVFSSLTSLIGVPGLEFNPAMLLHGEQDLTIHKPIPADGTATHSGKVTDIFDKGKGALVVTEVESKDGSGDLLFTNKFSAFIRGEGGFGGDSGPKPGNTPPEREPDLVVESPTLPQQALIYRLSGDKNPLHADPDFAKLGGYQQPILHGLCSFGIACKAVVDNMLDGDVTKVSRFAVRFSGTVLPGQTLVTSMWREGSEVILQTSTKEGAPVLTNAVAGIRG